VRFAEFYCSPAEAQTYVRCILPARHLPGYALPIWFPPDQRTDELCPVSVWEHPGEAHHGGMEASKAAGQRVYVDVDDNYAMADGFDGYDEDKAAWHRRCVEESDGVICASENLAEYYAELHPNVHFIPHGVDPKEWEFRRTESKYLRIGWSAGTTHDVDAPLVEPALRWAAEQDGVQVVVVGVDPKWDFEYWHYPWLPLEAYWRLIGTFAIGLAPLLDDTPLNHFRSDLKWLDYSMAGAMTIASDKPAYNRSITNGVNGVLARGPESWLASVQQAVYDVGMRAELIVNAQTHCMLRRHAAGYRPAYLDALGFARVAEAAAA
jgi:hypothetical protein